MDRLLVAPIAALLVFPVFVQGQQLASSKPGKPDTSVFRPIDWATPDVYRTASGMPGPEYWQQKADYTIRASLDPTTHTIEGAETVRYTNNSPDTLRFLWMQLDMNLGSRQSRMAPLDQYFFPEDSSFHIGATIERIRSVRAGPKGAKPTTTALPWWVNSTMMYVELDRPLPPKGVLTLDIGWHHQVPTQGGRTGRQEFPEGWLYQIAQWYPRLAVYDDVRGWNTDQYFGASEFYLEYGDFDVTVTAPSNYTLTATGTVTNGAQVFPALIQRRLALAAHSDTIVHIITAAELGTPALLPAGAGKTRTWHWTATNVRDFAWAAAPNFVWDETSWDGITMQAFYPPSASDIWSTAADMNRHAIKIHSRWLHYPWPTAISVEGPVGGMEYPMITFDQADSPKELYYTLAHEQGHEWFPMIVGSDERLFAWMDEGFNTFIDWYTFRDRYPTDTTRIQSLEFGSMRAFQQFLATDTGLETPIMETQDRSPSGLMSGWNAYGKPAVALHFLREQVVDSTHFDAAFREYVRRWAFKHPRPDDFFRTMDNALGEDLSWFWRSWFYRTDHLDQAVDSVQQQDTAGRTISRVFLSNRREMVAPVMARVTGVDGSVRMIKLPVETWWTGPKAVWLLVDPSKSKPVKIELDPKGDYPDVDRSNNTWPRSK